MNPENPIRVIIRGLRDKPAALFAVEIRGGVVDAYGANPNNPVPFHAERVFEFNAVIYGKLCEAFNARRTGDLASLWNKTTPLFR